MKKMHWQKDYDFDSLYDLGRDIHESFDPRFNENAAKPVTDQYGVFSGVYRVTILYIEGEEL